MFRSHSNSPRGMGDTTLLEKLVAGLEASKTVLIKDTSRHPGRILLKSIASGCSLRFSSVHLFLFELPPHEWLKGMPQEVNERLSVHDCYTDHMGWDSDTETGPIPLHTATLHAFQQEVGGIRVDKATPPSSQQQEAGRVKLDKATPPSCRKQEVGGVGSDCAIFIDSLSSLLLFHSAPHVCKLIHNLGRWFGMVACLLHADLHDNHVITQLGHVTSSVIDVNPIPSSLTAEYQLELQLNHLRLSGKLLREREWVKIERGLKLVATVASKQERGEREVTTETADPTANLTFKLSLKENEKQQRSTVPLPYHIPIGEKAAILQGIGCAGQIFYQPDKDDDFDDSDPDDDLDI